MSDPISPVAWGIQLSKLWIASGQSFPVGVREVALEVTKTKYAEPIGLVVPHGIRGIDGMLSRREKKKDWCISYDETVLVPGRINFTIAHELGHYLLHRKQSDIFQCGKSEMLDYASPESMRIESQANTFASYLLMPRNDFEAQISGQELTFELLRHCADRYQTSLTATVIKWLEFTEQAAMLVVADHDEYICWTYCSQAAKRIKAYKEPGEMLPTSVVERLRNHANSLGASKRIPPGVWHSTEEALESFVISEQYEQIIFLIRFPSALAIEHKEEVSNDAFVGLIEIATGAKEA
jgi:Zn-dependent peptidase ImmA (M78 family)